MRTTFLLLILMSVIMNANAQSVDSQKSFDVKVKELGEIQMIYYDFTGPYDQAFNDFGQLMGYIQQQKIPMGPHSLGVFYDDPQQVAPDKLRSEIGYMVTAEVKPEKPYKYKTIEAGKAVSVRYTSMDEIMPAYQAISEYIIRNNLKTREFSIEMYYSYDESTVDAEIMMLLL